jgi:Protein of unknown function (DUF3662)/FHA domain
VGVFDRFERRLERLVEGAFGRVFKGEAVPADIAHALQREADDRRVVVGAGRMIAPNAFVVVLGDHDHERLMPYAEPLGEAFAEMLEDHAKLAGYSLAGPVQVELQHDPALDTGRFQVRSVPGTAAGVVRPGPSRSPAQPPPPPSAPSAPPAPTMVAPSIAPPPMAPRRPPPPHHRIVITSSSVANPGNRSAGTPPDLGEERSVPLLSPVTVLGRSAGADVQLADPGVSRRHAELHLTGDAVRLLDAGSTNGTTVNGEQVTARQLRSGDRIQIGSTVLIYRAMD